MQAGSDQLPVSSGPHTLRPSPVSRDHFDNPPHSDPPPSSRHSSGSKSRSSSGRRAAGSTVPASSIFDKGSYRPPHHLGAPESSPPLSLEQLQRLKRELLSERGSSSDDRHSLHLTSSAEDDDDSSDVRDESDAGTPRAVAARSRLPVRKPSFRDAQGQRPRRLGRLTSREKLTRLSFGQDLGKAAAGSPPAEPLAGPLPSTPVNGPIPFPIRASPSSSRIEPPAPALPVVGDLPLPRLLAPTGRRFRKKHASVSSEFLESLKDTTSWGRTKGSLLQKPQSRSVGAAAGLSLLDPKPPAQPPQPAREDSGATTAGKTAAADPTSQPSTLRGLAPAKAKGTGRRYVSLPPGLFVAPPPSHTPSIPFPTSSATAPQSPLPAPVAVTVPASSATPPQNPSPPPAAAIPRVVEPEQTSPNSVDRASPAAEVDERAVSETSDDMNHQGFHPADYARGAAGQAADQREMHQTMGPKKGQQVLRAQQQQQGHPQGVYAAFSEEDEDEGDLSGEEDDYGHPSPHHPYDQGHLEQDEGEEYDDDDPAMQYSPRLHDDPHRNIYQEADLDGHGHPHPGGGLTPGPIGPDGLPVRGWDAVQSQHNSRLPPPLTPAMMDQQPSNTGAAPTSTGGVSGADPYAEQQWREAQAARGAAGQVPQAQQQPQHRSRRPSMGRPNVRGAPAHPTVPQPLAPQPQQQQAMPAQAQAQQLPPGAAPPGRSAVQGGPPHEQNDMVRRYLASMKTDSALPPEMDDPRSRVASPVPQQQQQAYPTQSGGGAQQQQQQHVKAYHPLPPVPQQAPPPPQQQSQGYGNVAPGPTQGSAGIQFPRQQQQAVPHSGGTGSSLGVGESPTVAGARAHQAPRSPNPSAPPKTNASKVEATAHNGAGQRARRNSAGAAQVSSPPGSNRARLGHNSASSANAPMLPLAAAGGGAGGSRRRRVSDGSATGALKKDMLLNKMAEALTAEREKAGLYQKEFNEAEREIDELAVTIDEMKKQHAKTVSLLKKEIGALKKEREALVQALEEAEGLDDEEADRYLSLLDPAQAALLHGTSEAGDDVADDFEDPVDAAEAEAAGDPRPHSPGKGSRLAPGGTVRAQMQEKAAQRQQRINAAILQLAPESNPELVTAAAANVAPAGHHRRDATSSAEDVPGGVMGAPRKHRSSGERGGSRGIVRRLSKRRPESRQSREGAPAAAPPGSAGSRSGAGGSGPYGFFRGRRSSSTSRRSQTDLAPQRASAHGPYGGGRGNTTAEMLDHAPAPGTANGSGFFDSGSLYPRNALDGGSRRGDFEGDSKQKNKIGKLFRKVFPAYRDESEFTESEDEGDHRAVGGRRY